MDKTLAKYLLVGDKIQDGVYKNKKGIPYNYKVNGKVKLWKRSPDKIKIPIKFGLWEYGYVTENNIHLFEISEDLREKLLSSLLTDLDKGGM